MQTYDVSHLIMRFAKHINMQAFEFHVAPFSCLDTKCRMFKGEVPYV